MSTAHRFFRRHTRCAPLRTGCPRGSGPGRPQIPGNLIKLLVEAQALNGLITPILLTYVLVLANRASVLGDAANGRAVAAVAVLSATVLVQTILSGLGIA